MRPDAGACARPGTTLVTGASGFVGAHVVAELAATGRRVVAAGLEPPPAEVEAWWNDDRERISMIELDVRDAAAVTIAIERHQPDGIVHAAAVTDPSTGSLTEINIAGTRNVLGAARPVRRTFVSSASVYDLARVASSSIAEDSPTVVPPGEGQDNGQGDGQDDGPDDGPDDGQRWTYGKSKRAAELWCLKRPDIRICRVGACFGPLERPTRNRTAMSVAYQALHARREGRTVRLEPDGVSDLLYVRDTARGILAVHESDGPARIVNVARIDPAPIRSLSAAVNAYFPAARDRATDVDRLLDEPLLIRVDGRVKPLDGRRLSALETTQQHDFTRAVTAYGHWLDAHEF